jgi:diguanylate cyclase (GGDEF)-like protein
MAAMYLFEEARDEQLAIDASSQAAAYASRLGELALASELATKTVLALDNVADDRIVIEVANRLGIFCYSFLDYDRAVEQFEISLAAARRIGDGAMIARQRHNVADALLLSARQMPGLEVQERTDRVLRAERLTRQLIAEATPEVNRQFATHRLLAEALCQLGRPEEAFEELNRSGTEGDEVLSSALKATLNLVEARCLRMLGRPTEGVRSATRAVELASESGDEHEIMLTLQERAACSEAAGDLRGALRDASKVNTRIRNIHHRQTSQVVEQIWTRTDLERERRRLAVSAADAIRAAEEDVVTGIGNRRRLERVFTTSGIDHGRDVAVVIADVDHFKQINDLFGHVVGDAVLRRLGQLFRDELRAGQEVVRYGGDEFVFALPRMQLETTRDFAERVRASVEVQPWDQDAAGLAVTVSFGVACGPIAKWQAMLVDADVALYAAKERGRNAVEVSSSSSSESIEKRTSNKS